MDSEMEWRERVVALEQDRKSIHRRIDTLERLTESVHEIAVELRVMREDLTDILERVNEIEHKPTKRYESIVMAIITAIIGVMVGHFLPF